MLQPKKKTEPTRKPNNRKIQIVDIRTKISHMSGILHYYLLRVTVTGALTTFKASSGLFLR